MNVHFILQSDPDPDVFGWGGRAQFPSDNPNYACAVRTLTLTPQIIGEILTHEIGHNLGLYHTHHPGRNNNHVKNEDCGNCYHESVSRTRGQGLAYFSTIGQRKCKVNGDFLCDTPADPALT